MNQKLPLSFKLSLGGLVFFLLVLIASVWYLYG
nr:MAG TPA: Nitrate/nitrite sensor histidine kinase NarQ protein, sensor, histidine kinase [Inoviridae sp. ctiYN10]